MHRLQLRFQRQNAVATDNLELNTSDSQPSSAFDWLGCWRMVIVLELKNLLNDRNNLRTIHQIPIFHVDDAICEIQNAVVMGHK